MIGVFVEPISNILRARGIRNEGAGENLRFHTAGWRCCWNTATASRVIGTLDVARTFRIVIIADVVVARVEEAPAIVTDHKLHEILLTAGQAGHGQRRLSAPCLLYTSP